jgi:hypothetical protein
LQTLNQEIANESGREEHSMTRRSGLLLTLVGLLLTGNGLPAQGMNRDQAVAEIKRRGGDVSVDPDRGVTITLSKPEHGDDDLKLVAAVPDVAVLYLDNNQVTVAGLAHLRNLPGLKEVTLRKSQVTQAAVDEFKKARPGVFVTWDPKKYPFRLDKLLFGLGVCGVLAGVGTWFMVTTVRRKKLSGEFRLRVFLLGMGLAVIGLVLLVVSGLQALGHRVSLADLF